MAPQIRTLILSCLTSFVSAQTISYGNGTVAATSGTVAPAAAIIQAPGTSLGGGRFAWESVQLTQAVLANLTRLNLTGIELFKYSALQKPGSSQCKTFPGDSDWPSTTAWKVLDLLSGGATIRAVPLAASCYKGWPEYNSTDCAFVTKNWNDPHLHVADPTSTQWPLFEGLTCLPPSLRNGSNTCTLGGYASYSVNVTNVAQIQLALNFARNTNLRLVIRNTGHDFAAKSIGAGALSIWTHNLKTLEYIPNYTDKSYKGSAFRIGAGVETEDVYRVAEQNGVTVVGGECRTVGLAGGYIAGGGHSPMSSLVGMAADQVISMNVVLPNGDFVTASASQNSDLFWALRGGGGGTFGVVTSVIIKAYPKIPVTTMTFNYTTSPTLSNDTFWKGLGVYMSYFATFTDAGTYGYWNIAPGPNSTFVFTFNPFWGGNLTEPQLKALVAPFLKDLTNLGIPVNPVYTQYSSFYPAWNASFPPEVVGSWTNHAASRLFPRENFANSSQISATLSAVRHALEGGNAVLVGYNIKSAANPPSHVDQNNAVNPAWRNTLTHFILAALWGEDTSFTEIASISETMTNDWMARWRAVSPGAGSYMSESDINEPNFQQAFFGSNYARLYAIKQQLDPSGLLYSPQGVGSEDWYITGQIPYLPTQNGKLCRKK